MVFTHTRGVAATLALSIGLIASIAARRASVAVAGPPAFAGDISGTVQDSISGKPLPGGEVRILQGSTIVATTETDPFGRFVVHNLSDGDYTVAVRYLGFHEATQHVTLAGGQEVTVQLRLAATPVNLEAIEVNAAVPLAVDTRTGNQVFKQNDYHGAPT
ncbi:MAG TPA: carboxypeptidase-like regulatory domain-containing protein, partial [Gemmatimonadales bacterium]|nr:carboxypeptidase-like regulatory domain-containing protein [Gemmatimonadales bacterium]